MTRNNALGYQLNSGTTFSDYPVMAVPIEEGQLELQKQFVKHTKSNVSTADQSVANMVNLNTPMTTESFYNLNPGLLN